MKKFKSHVTDLEEDYFWAIENQWVYDEKGMRIRRRVVGEEDNDFGYQDEIDELSEVI